MRELIIIFHCPASCAHECCGGEKEHITHAGLSHYMVMSRSADERTRERERCTHASASELRSFALGGCIISYWIIDRV
jgi:hypothetical protein